jgi:hypothetical protein
MAAPIADLHPDDTAARDQVAATLIDIATKAKVTGRTLGARLGRTQSAVSVMQRARAWEVTSVQRWARALDHRLVIVLDGLDIPDDGDELAAVYSSITPDGTIAEDVHHLRVTVNDLARIRRARQITHAAMAASLGLSANATAWAEDHPDGWRVPSVQRYARALAGVAVFELAPVEVEAVAG